MGLHGKRERQDRSLETPNSPNVPAASYAAEPRAIAVVAEAARRLIELRDRWLNPPEWVDWVDEPAPGYPRRPVPRDEDAGEGAPEAHADETSTTTARSGSLTRTRRSMPPSRPPTAGRPTSATRDSLRELLELNGSS